MNDYPENATLDLTAYRAGLAAYRQLVSTYVAEALLCSNDDEHRRLLRFARGLDEAGLSIRSEVDLHLETFHERDAASAWKAPITRKAADSPDPWGDDPPF